MDGIDFLKEYHAHSEQFFPLIDHISLFFPKRNEFDDVNIGWNCGLLDPQRPYFLECWATEGLTLLTIFISTRGIENMSAKDMDTMLEEKKIYHRLPGRYQPEMKTFTDINGNSFYSFNLFVGDEEKTYIDNSTQIYGFAKLNEFNGHTEKKEEKA